jgi:hypothetical protein
MANDPTNVSPKVTFAAVGSAIATIIWTVLALTVLKNVPETAIAALTGATGTVLAFIFGWLVRDPARTSVDATRVPP